MEIDSFDKKILYELEKNSSIPSSFIAKKIDRSKEFVNFRIHRLENEEIILGYSAIVDMARLGYFTLRIYLKWQNITQKEKAKFYEFLKSKKNVWTTTVLHGKWDFAFFVGIKSEEYIESFHQLWNEINLKYKEKIQESKIAIYSPVHNFNKIFFMDYNNKIEIIERIYGTGKLEKFDELDEKIIELYSLNVRKPLYEIADKLKINPETVRLRIKNLEKKKIIVGYKINLNLEKLGYQGYRVDFQLNSIKKNSEIFNYLKNHKYFYQINNSIGGADFETEIVVKNLHHLLDVLEEVMEKFKGTIKSYEYFGYSEFPSLSIVPD